MTSGPLIGYVPGVFDLFHVGRELCDVLVAGVVSDEVCEQVKGIAPFVSLEEGIAVVDSVGIVDATYAEPTPDKVEAWREVGFSRLFKGDDWKDSERGRALERRLAPYGVEVVHFPYTVHTSSTQLRALIAASRPA